MTGRPRRILSWSVLAMKIKKTTRSTNQERGRSVTRQVVQERNLHLQLHASMINDMYRAYKAQLPATPQGEERPSTPSKKHQRGELSKSVSDTEVVPGRTRIITSKDFAPESIAYVSYRVTGLLNRLSSGNFRSVADQILSLMHTFVDKEKERDTTGRSADVTQEVVELIVDKALDEVLYTNVYVRLLSYLAEKLSPLVAWRLYADGEGVERKPLDEFITGGAVVRFVLWRTLYDGVNRCVEMIMPKPYFASLSVLSDETQDEYYYIQSVKHRRRGLAALIAAIFRQDFMQPRGYMSLCLAEGQPHDLGIAEHKKTNRPIRSSSVARSVSRPPQKLHAEPVESEPSPKTTSALKDTPTNRALLMHSVVHPLVLLVPHEEALEYLHVLLQQVRSLLDFAGSPSGDLFVQYDNIFKYSCNYSGPEVTSRARFMLQDLISSHEKHSGDMSGVNYARKSFRNMSPHI